MPQKEMIAQKRIIAAKDEKKIKKLSKIAQLWAEMGDDKGKIINMRAVLR
jgi:hypothetical protein